MAYIIFGCSAIISLISSWCVTYAGRSVVDADRKPSFFIASTLFLFVLGTISYWIYQNTTGVMIMPATRSEPCIGSKQWDNDTIDTMSHYRAPDQYSRHELLLETMQSASDTSYTLLACITAVLALIVMFVSLRCSHWAYVGLLPVLVLSIHEYNMTNRYSHQVYHAMTAVTRHTCAEYT